MVFDIHVHVFPDNFAERSTQSIAGFYDNMPMHGTGRVSDVLRQADEGGVDRMLIHSVATSEAHAKSINNFISTTVRAHPDRFVGFMALHPDTADADMEAEIERAQALGLVGVKLHPDIQHFSLTEPRSYRMFEKLAGRLPVLIHAGDYRYHYSNPALIEQVLTDFPTLTVIAAHMGGWTEWERAAEMLPGRHDNLYVDASSTLFAVGPQRMAELIHLFGADRIFFGSDYPTRNLGDELRAFNEVPISEEEKEKIRWGNACRFFERSL